MADDRSVGVVVGGERRGTAARTSGQQAANPRAGGVRGGL
jgi:hypothetical protein